MAANGVRGRKLMVAHGVHRVWGRKALVAHGERGVMKRWDIVALNVRERKAMGAN